jgi:hypothetical protein
MPFKPLFTIPSECMSTNQIALSNK